MDKHYKSAISLFLSCVSFLVGDVDTPLVTLLTFVIIDFIVGIMRAIKNHDLNSQKCYDGLYKKSMILIIIIIATTLDRLINPTQYVIRTVVAYFYITNEGISILENIASIGVKIPQKLIDILEQLNNEDS